MTIKDNALWLAANQDEVYEDLFEEPNKPYDVVVEVRGSSEQSEIDVKVAGEESIDVDTPVI